MSVQEFNYVDIISLDRFGNHNIILRNASPAQADSFLRNMGDFYSHLVFVEHD